MSSGTTTTNHDEIRKWVEKRGGTPTVVKGTEGRDGEGILRIDFAEPDDKLEPVSWDEVFETFEDIVAAVVGPKQHPHMVSRTLGSGQPVSS